MRTRASTLVHGANGVVVRPAPNAAALLLIAALAGIVALGLLPASAPGASVKRADARLDRALQGLVGMKGGPPGATALIDRGRNTRFHRAGVGGVSTARPFRRDDHVRIASVAKAFSGAVTLTLVDRGRLALDDTVGELLAGFPAAWSDVTLRQALNHTAGLPDYIKDPAFREKFGANPRRYFFPLELIDFVSDQPLSFAPGSRYDYSDTDNIVVALMAEAATGSSYESLLRRLVYGPLGLRRTSLPTGFLMPHPFVRGYAVEPGQAPENVSKVLNASAAWASGGMVSTPADLNRFIRGYGGGKLFGDLVRKQQRKFVPGGESGPPGPGANSAGLGIFRYETRCGTVVGHTGNMPGYTQFIATTLKGRRSVIVSINTQLNSETSAKRFNRLRRAEELAVCAALARGGT